ncbi:hypothetical protein ACVIIV_002108 [Bradyrhizobium sp. USDA 4354]
MFTVLNLDGIFEPDWTPALGDRVFKFDGFISHNRNDGSSHIAAQLRSLGVSIWHDEDADLRERKVQAHVARALRASRYLVVYVSAQFRDSAWVQCEYRPTFELEKHGNLIRTVVLSDGDESLIPAALRNAPRFGTNSLKQLADFLREGNRLDFNPDEILKGCAVRIDSVRPGESKMEKEANSGVFSERLFLERNRVQLQPGLLDDPDSANGESLRRLAFSATRSSDADNRANGLMLLEAIDKRWLRQQTLDDLLVCLAQESDSSLVGYMASWLAGIVDRLTSDRLALANLVVLRSPDRFQHQFDLSLLNRLPEAVRCRVFIGDTLGGLNRAEMMSLVKERLDYISEIAGMSYPSELGAAGVVHQISEWETLLREICTKVLGISSGDERFASEVCADGLLLREALQALNRIMERCRSDAATCSAMEEWLLDYMIIPLMFYRSIPDLWADARRIILGACDALSGSAEIAHEVPCYRGMLDRIDAGVEFDLARRELQMCMLRSA